MSTLREATTKQLRILNFVLHYENINNKRPSLRIIAKQFKISHPQAHYYISVLKRRGLLEEPLYTPKEKRIEYVEYTVVGNSKTLIDPPIFKSIIHPKSKLFHKKHGKNRKSN